MPDSDEIVQAAQQNDNIGKIYARSSAASAVRVYPTTKSPQKFADVEYENKINQSPPPTDQSIPFFTTTVMASLALEPAPSRLTILISGSGTNLQALIDACSSRLLPNTSIVRVISNRKAAFGLKRAENAGIPTTYHGLLAYKKRFKETEDTATSKPPDAADAADTAARTAYDADLAALVLADTPDLVVCAGWMHILTTSFLSPLSTAKIPIINLHPSLPGEFDGANAIARAYAAFQEGRIKCTGVMIHHVVRDVDRGEPIIVREVEMREGEGLEGLEERIHVVEHELIVRGTGMALARLWEGRERGKDEEESKKSTTPP